VRISSPSFLIIRRPHNGKKPSFAQQQWAATGAETFGGTQLQTKQQNKSARLSITQLNRRKKG